jgi:HemY protein
MNIFVIVVILLLALMGGLGLGYLIQIDTGYVRLSWSHWLMETNVWIAALLLIALYLGLNLFFKTVGKTLAVKAGFMQWREKGTNRRAQLRTNRGLLELAEGNWRKAERYLARSANQSSVPLVNYFAAAQAASEQGKFAESDKLLEQASKHIEGSYLAVGLTQAQMQLTRGQPEDSFATLQKLRAHAPHHPFLLRLIKQVLVQMEKWHELSELLPDLRKFKALDGAELEDLQLQVWSNALLQASRKAKADKPEGVYLEPLNEVWQRMPSSLRKSADMVSRYAEQLAALGANDTAVAILEKHLRHDWNEDLLLLYGQIDSNAEHQLSAAENWLKVHHKDAPLLLTAGRLAMRSQQWTKAREYFEASLKLADSPATCAELGRLLVHLETPSDASAYLLRAINGSGSASLSELPEPSQSTVTTSIASHSATNPDQSDKNQDAQASSS